MNKLVRSVTRDECFWLDEDLPIGMKVHIYRGCTYGCVGDGIAVTLEPGKMPFFEVPCDAIFRPAAKPQEERT
jgi:hypothetical protein